MRSIDRDKSDLSLVKNLAFRHAMLVPQTTPLCVSREGRDCTDLSIFKALRRITFH